MSNRKIQTSTLISHAIKLSLTNIWRNKFLSIATISVIAIILFTFNIILSIDAASKNIITKTTQTFDIVVYLNNDIDALEGLALAAEIEKLPAVKKVTFRSKEQALELMRESSPETVKLLERNKINNPFPPDLKIITKSIEEHQEVLDYIKRKHSDKLHPIFNNISNKKSNQLIKTNKENQEIINSLSSKVTTFIKETKEIIFWTILIFLIGGLLIMMNAIQLTIFNRQKEIEIMKLVGATYNFIKLPYIIEGAFYAAAAVVANLVLTVITATQSNIGPINALSLQEYASIFGTELLIAVFLGILSSYITVNRYLKA